MTIIEIWAALSALFALLGALIFYAALKMPTQFSETVGISLLLWGAIMLAAIVLNDATHFAIWCWHLFK